MHIQNICVCMYSRPIRHRGTGTLRYDECNEEFAPTCLSVYLGRGCQSWPQVSIAFGC